MDKCKKYCDKKYVSTLKSYATKNNSINSKKLKLFNNPFWNIVMKEGCKEDLCNKKCKYTASRKKVFNKLKKKRRQTKFI